MHRLDSFIAKPRQNGINMVDLMMWLVIAALLLAAALQSIGYYQKATFLNTMASDAAGAGSVVMGTAATTGSIDLATVEQGASSTKWSTKVAHLVQQAEVTGSPYIRVTHPQVTNLDVVYLFAACGDKYKVGVNIVPKDSNVILEECGIGASPGGGSGGGVTVPTTPTMISVWDTSLPGCTTITLPVNGTINASVDWGDGATASLTSSSRTHVYASASGAKTITINGTFTGWGATSSTWTPSCITEVKGWGPTGTTSLAYAFAGAKNITAVPNIPVGVTDTARAFQGATIFNGNINDWDVSKVVDMQGMFFSANAFNQPLDKWKTTSLENTSDMFAFAASFNQPIGGWDMSKWKYGSGTFYNAAAFNQPLTWTTPNLMYTSSMFRDTKKFNQDLNWDTSKVVDMSNMFDGSVAFNGNISGWKTDSLTNMTQMFMTATAFNGDISTWNTSKVTKMPQVFQNSKAFNKNISGWNVTLVTDWAAFYSGSVLTSANVPAKLR